MPWHAHSCSDMRYMMRSHDITWYIYIFVLIIVPWVIHTFWFLEFQRRQWLHICSHCWANQPTGDIIRPSFRHRKIQWKTSFYSIGDLGCWRFLSSKLVRAAEENTSTFWMWIIWYNEVNTVQVAQTLSWSSKFWNGIHHLLIEDKIDNMLHLMRVLVKLTFVTEYP